MKPETLIYDRVKLIIPKNSDKTVFFAAISDTSYEVIFYSFIDGKPVQCFALAEQNILDENELDVVFDDIVNVIKSSKVYKEDKLNIATIILDRAGIEMSVDYHGLDESLYKVKKEWKQSVLCNNN